eukprot:gb/GECH01008044.1/.p1 GENE.gb/GECH01008044.1/~~gb/GECH01008044.1/.p1  ORF type:complete len:832 (+),score=215.86 gb/GECH01008044.1/:1-2496(+)
MTSSKPREHLMKTVEGYYNAPIVMTHPHDFQFSPFKESEELFFLKKKQHMALWKLDLHTQEQKPVLNSISSNSSSESKEEQLLRERMRMANVQGISNFKLNPQKEHETLIQQGNTVNIYNMNNEEIMKYGDDVKGTKMDVKYSGDGYAVACVCDGDLYVADLFSKQDKLIQMTHVHDRHPHRYAAIADYVAQEELDRYTGYWWAPLSGPGTDVQYRILYAEVDEGHVDQVTLHAGVGEMDHIRFPAAGRPNPSWTMRVAEMTRRGDESGALDADGVRLLSMTPAAREYISWAEYLVRAGWCPNGEQVWMLLSDREQQRYDLILFQISEHFQPMGTTTELQNTNDNSTDVHAPSPVTVFSNHSKIWQNHHDLTHFLQDGSIISASEETGYRHLYLYKPQPSSSSSASSSIASYECYPITSGEWTVDIDTLKVDERRQIVYFTGTFDTPLEKHIYAASFRESVVNKKKPPQDNIVRISTENAGFHENIVFNGSATMMACAVSSLDEPHTSHLFQICDGKEINDRSPLPQWKYISRIQGISNTSKESQQEQQDSSPASPSSFSASSSTSSQAFRNSIVSPKIVSIKRDIGTMHGFVYLPHNYEEGKKYPTMVFIYGGPHVQLVTNQYMAGVRPLIQVWTSLGYCVCTFDGRGSFRRGLEWEGALKYSMGTVEIDDQIAGLKHVSSEMGCIDMDRIGVFGWSYGGYMTLMCMAQRSDFFRLGVAGAPVTRWELYDTGYTERYMGIPEQQKEAYGAGSVIRYVDGFPDDEGRLMIFHGLMDENVHFTHTETLTQEMMKRNKPYDLRLFPTERHGPRSREARSYMAFHSTRFIQRFL